MLDFLKRARRARHRTAVLQQMRKTILNTADARFQSAGITPVPIRVAFSGEPRSPADMILRRENGQVSAVFSETAQPSEIRILSGRVAAHAYWFSNTSVEVQEISTDLSDGDAPSCATYRFSVTPNVGVAVPDAYFFKERGYQDIDTYAAEHATPWDARDDDIVWRGSLTGNGLFSLDPANQTNPGVKQRLRMAMACQSVDIDFKFVHPAHHDSQKVLQAAGLTADPLPPTTWGHKKYAVDIDGYSNAWNNFMQRLRLGCCVLKVDSQFGFSQWYYHRLTPWEHYVPIKADLSDLAQQIDWVKAHSGRAKEIAAAGQAIAASLTMESETQVAAEIIEKHEAKT